MKIYASIIVVSLVLSACARSAPLSDELQGLKAACVGGYWEICADIGHQVRQAQAEEAKLARAQ